MQINIVRTCGISVISLIMCPVLWSCRASTGHPIEETAGKRDNVESVQLISIDSTLPPMHSNSNLIISGDTLIIYDGQQRDRLFAAYDIASERYVGSFGKFGTGPGEMSYLGGLYADRGGNIFALNTGRMTLQGINMEKALSDSTCKAFDKVRLDNSDYMTLFVTPHYVNDTTVLCSLYGPGESGFSSRLGRFNPDSGAATFIDTVSSGDVGKCQIAVDINQNIIASTGYTHDRIKIFDTDGNLKKTIYGPDYKEKHDGVSYYFSSPVIAGDRLYVSYNGSDIRNDNSVYGKDIFVMDLDGKYIKTLHLEAKVNDMKYHHGTNRLFIHTDGEPQFGYIQLDD